MYLVEIQSTCTFVIFSWENIGSKHRKWVRHSFKHTLSCIPFQQINKYIDFFFWMASLLNMNMDEKHPSFMNGCEKRNSGKWVKKKESEIESGNKKSNTKNVQINKQINQQGRRMKKKLLLYATIVELLTMTLLHH